MIEKKQGPKVKGHPSIAALKPSYEVEIRKTSELLPLTRQTALVHTIR